MEANTDRILTQFAAAGAHGTFFTLGWIAERYPQVVRRIVAAGHELASHGYGHAQVHTLTPDAFRADIRRAKDVLEQTGGVAVRGYRAPTFSIGPRTPWAYRALEDEGHRYSSSIFPIRHDLYGEPDAPRFAFQPQGGTMWELPMTTVRLFGRNLPCAGGGYFRLLPYMAYRMGLGRLNRGDRQSGIFYFHPWEVDPGQPRVDKAGSAARFRHYVKHCRHVRPAGSADARLPRWDRMDRVFTAARSRLTDGTALSARWTTRPPRPGMRSSAPIRPAASSTSHPGGTW